MISLNNAEMISPEELVGLLKEECKNPTMERLMFIETKGDPIRPDKPGKIFPCYVAAYTEEPELMFKVYLNQYANGEFQMVMVILPAKDMGVNKRLWDRPPTSMVREFTPWMDSGVAQ